MKKLNILLLFWLLCPIFSFSDTANLNLFEKLGKDHFLQLAFQNFFKFDSVSFEYTSSTQFADENKHYLEEGVLDIVAPLSFRQFAVKKYYEHDKKILCAYPF